MIISSITLFLFANCRHLNDLCLPYFLIATQFMQQEIDDRVRNIIFSEVAVENERSRRLAEFVI